MNPDTIAVIGATGNVGRPLVEQLLAAQVPLRLLARDPSKLAPWHGRVDARSCAFTDARQLEDALRGCDKLFTLSFIEAPPELDRGLIDAAARARVRHVVKLSTIGVDSGLPIGQRHREREQWIEASGMAWTFLRPGYFMSNATQWAPSIREHGRVSTPSVDARFAPIDPRDIAAVAALALTTPGHEGKAYTLTGRELITVREQVATLSRVLGRGIECVELDIPSALEGARRSGRPDWLVTSLEVLWRSLAAGAGEQRTEVFHELTGQTPRRFEAWCVEHRARFG